MRRIIKKLFFVWDFDKEEKWLNEMAAKGLCLVSTGFCNDGIFGIGRYARHHLCYLQ